MQLTFSQGVFFILFFSFFFLLLLIGETPFGIFLLGCIACLLLSSFRSLTKTRANENVSRIANLPIITFVLFLGWSFITTFFSLSIPLSLNKLIVYLLSFACLYFFAKTDEKKLPTSFVVSGLLLTGIGLLVMNYLFLVLPFLGKYLPEQNLLVATYGHNHAGAFFLFLLPLSFAFIPQEKFTFSSTRAWLIPFFLTTGIILSAGRAVMGLAVLTYLFFYWQFSKKLANLVFVPASILIIALCVFSVIPIISHFLQRDVCLLPTTKQQLCKTFVQEKRLYYWHQAWQAFVDRPAGWGGGTFVLLSNRYTKSLQTYSAYAHNEYLQVLAEQGFVGGVTFGLFVLSIIWVCSIHLRQRQSDRVKLAFFLAVSVCLLLLNAFVDYDWSFTPMWIGLMVVLGLLLRQTKAVGVRAPKWLCAFNMPDFSRVQLGILGVSCGVVFGWSFFYSLSTWWWMTGQYERSLTTFPFVYGRVEDGIGSTVISPQTREKLLSLYHAHPLVIRQQLKMAESDNEKLELLKTLSVLETQNIANHLDLMQLYLKKKDPFALTQEWQLLSQEFQDEQLWWFYRERIKELADDSMTLANETLSKDPVAGVQLYLQVYSFFPSAVHQNSFRLLEYPTQFDEHLIHQVLQTVQPSNRLWRYHETLEKYYLGRAKSLAEHAQWSEANQEVAKLLNFTPWAYTDASRELGQIYTQAYLQESQRNATSSQIHTILSSWQELHQLLVMDRKQQGLDQNFVVQLRDALIRSGEAFATVEPQQAFAYFEYVDQLEHGYFSQNANSRYLKALQKMSDEFVRRQQWERAEQVIRFMMTMAPDDYWVSAELGNLAYLRGDKSQALAEYTHCLAKMGNHRSDCEYGRQSVVEDWGDSAARYWQASTAIERY